MIDYFQPQTTKPQQQSEEDLKKQKEKQKEKQIKTGNFLFIGNLPLTIDEYELDKLITDMGKYTIDSMSIKKSSTQAYAYIKLSSKKEVEEVKKGLNLKSYKDRLLQVDIFKKADKRKEEAKGKVFFSGFALKTNEEKVLSFFKSIGEIVLFKPKRNLSQDFLGSGTIGYSSYEEASKAVEELNNTEYEGSKITVMKFIQQDKTQKEGEDKFPVVLIENLPFSIQNDEDLKASLRLLVEVSFCSIIKENSNGNFQFIPLGIALLSSSSDVDKCIFNSKDKELNPFHLKISKAELSKLNVERLAKAKNNSFRSKYEGSNLVVKGLPKELKETDVSLIFKQFGRIKSIKLITEGTMKEKFNSNGELIDKEYVYVSKGIAYVLFSCASDAKDAMDCLNNKHVLYDKYPLELRIEYFNYDKQGKKQQSKANTYQTTQGNTVSNSVIPLRNELGVINNYVNGININDPERQDKIGEVLYEFIIKVIEAYSLNKTRSDVSSVSISMRITGILLQSDVSLTEILKDLTVFVETLRDLIHRIYSMS